MKSAFAIERLEERLNYSSYAPAAITTMLKVHVTITVGVGDYASSGTDEVVFKPTGKYEIIGGEVAGEHGTYAYQKVGANYAVLSLDDSVLGIETVYIEWTSAHQGLFAAVSLTDGFEAGTFRY
jgi:hypothetical protein